MRCGGRVRSGTRSILVRMGRHVDVRSRQYGEHEGLDERDQTLERVHHDEKQEPCHRRQGPDEIDGTTEQGNLQKARGRDAEDGEDHVASQHVARKDERPA